MSIVCSCCCSENCSFTWPGFASGAPATVPRGRSEKHYSSILRLRLHMIIGWIRKNGWPPVNLQANSRRATMHLDARPRFRGGRGEPGARAGAHVARDAQGRRRLIVCAVRRPVRLAH